MALVVRHYAVNIAYFDDYHMVPVFQSVSQHQFPIHSLWVLNNENREVFPKLLMMSVAYTSHWNTVDQMFVNIGLWVIVVTILWKLIGSTIKRPGYRLFSLLLISLWLFSPAQAENWLWSWEAVWFVCIGAVVLTIFLLHQNQTSKYWLGGAILSAVVASYSLVNGLLIWPIGLLMLIAQKRDRKQIGAWASSGFVVSLLYFFHYTKPTKSPPLGSVIHQPLNFIKFFLAFLGRPISDTMTASMTFGGILILLLIPLLYLCWLQRKNFQKLLPWFAIMVFALAACLTTDFARLGGGLGNSLSSRYATISIIYIVGFIGTLLTLLDTYKFKNTDIRLIVLTISVVTIPVLFSSYANGLRASQLRQQQMIGIHNCTQTAMVSDACLGEADVYETGVARNQLQYLKSKHWAGY